MVPFSLCNSFSFPLKKRIFLFYVPSCSLFVAGPCCQKIVSQRKSPKGLPEKPKLSHLAKRRQRRRARLHLQRIVPSPQSGGSRSEPFFDFGCPVNEQGWRLTDQLPKILKERNSEPVCLHIDAGPFRCRHVGYGLENNCLHAPGGCLHSCKPIHASLCKPVQEWKIVKSIISGWLILSIILHFKNQSTLLSIDKTGTLITNLSNRCPIANSYLASHTHTHCVLCLFLSTSSPLMMPGTAETEAGPLTYAYAEAVADGVEP